MKLSPTPVLALLALLAPEVLASSASKATSLQDQSWCSQVLGAAQSLDPDQSDALSSFVSSLSPICGSSSRRLDATSELAANLAFQPFTTTPKPLTINVKVDGKIVGSTQSNLSDGLSGVLAASNAVVATTSAPPKKGLKGKLESGAKGLLSKAEAAYCKLQGLVCTPVGCLFVSHTQLLISISYE